MCSVTVNIDEKIICGVNPNLSTTAAIRKWAQQLLDSHIQEMVNKENKALVFESTRDMSVEELYHAIEQDVKAIYAE